jgi:hypothetical protein
MKIRNDLILIACFLGIITGIILISIDIADGNFIIDLIISILLFALCFPIAYIYMMKKR